MDQITFLGTGDAMGVPRVYCDCPVCAEARESGSNRRMRSSVWVDAGTDGILIDCGPDWKEQMEQTGRRQMGDVLLTHAHFDHMAGLPEWADACRWTQKKGRLYAPAEVLVAVRRLLPWIESQIDFHVVGEALELSGWNITSCRMNHGKNGFSYAYRLNKSGYSWAYCPDTIYLQGKEVDFLRGLDLLVLGTSFYKEEFAPQTRSVYDMIEACMLLEEIKPERAVFTHMSHGVDVRNSYSLPEKVTLAMTGMRIQLRQDR